MKITLKARGELKRTTKFLNKIQKMRFSDTLNKYGEAGVQALKAATPVDSGKTAESWGYEVRTTHSGAEIVWTNTNINKGVNIAVILQYGHGTRNGGYVQGRDYINPAIRPVFDEIAESAWEEVTKA